MSKRTHSEIPMSPCSAMALARRSVVTESFTPIVSVSFSGCSAMSGGFLSGVSEVISQSLNSLHTWVRRSALNYLGNR